LDFAESLLTYDIDKNKIPWKYWILVSRCKG